MFWGNLLLYVTNLHYCHMDVILHVYLCFLFVSCVDFYPQFKCCTLDTDWIILVK